MKKAPNFKKSLTKSLEDKVTVAVWDEAKNAYDQKNYKETILKIIDYVGKDLREKHGNEDNTYFKIPHGSIVVEIEITKDEFKVYVPFLGIGEKSRIPLMRKIAELNFYPLNLSQIKLNDNQLNFHYATPLHLCEPYKIYYLLREICHNADYLDDELLSKFDVKLLHEPKITRYDDAFLEKAWTTFKSLLADAKSYFNYFDDKRLNNYNWDVINITLKQIDFILQPKGNLDSDIKEQINYLYAKEPVQDLVQRGKKYIESLDNISREAFTKDMYEVELFIPTKFKCDLSSIQNNWKGPFDNATKEIKNRAFESAILIMLLAFYDMYYHNFVPEEFDVKAQHILQNASGKDWETASNILHQGMKAILDGKPVGKEKPASKGFFSKLFK